MYVAFVAFALAGFLAFVGGILPGFGENTNSAARKALAQNFLVQCDALSDALNASTESGKSSDTTGNMDATALLRESENWLLPGYVALGDWKAIASGEYLYLYGQVDDADTALSFELSKLAGSSLVAGMLINGQLEPAGVSLPGTVPDKALVCAITRP